MSYESGKVYAVPIDKDHVVGPPIWEDHHRARNWLARMEEDPDAPGGCTRTFMDWGRGRFKYSIETLVEGDLIEFGADRMYMSTDGRARRRWVGEIVKFTDTQMQVRYFEDLEEMFTFIYDRDSRTQEAL
jgi:hypothetical protein